MDHEIHVPQTIEGAFAQGANEMIVVLPDSKTVHNESMYSSSVTTGNFEKFIANDVVTYVDAHYRTIPNRKSRGLVGHSMGGYGASRIGMKHSDIFGSLYIMSPCCMSARPTGPSNPELEKKLETVKTAEDSAKLSFFERVQLASMWRLPGGNFVSDWNWYDSVGDIDKRPPMFDYAWNAMQTNDVGMDEFMTLCKLIDTEPYITVNAGFGDAHSAAEEVEYMNGSANTRLGALRAHNGHPEPYHVKFWDIGNEPYGVWQLGRTDLKYYVLKHNEFASAMRKVDPSITLLASGAMPDEMTVTGQARTLHMPDSQAQFGSAGGFTGGLLAHSWGNFEGLTEHWYARAGKRFDYEHSKSLPPDAPNEDGYVTVDQTLLEWARYPSNRVPEKAEEWQEYQKRFPAMLDQKIFLSIDEYAYSGTPANLKLAPCLRHGLQRDASVHSFP